MSGFSQKSITPVHQRRVHNSLPRGQCNNSVLEISEIGNTGVLPSHINGDHLHDDHSKVQDRNLSTSTNDSKTITPGPQVGSPHPKSNLKTQDIYKLYSHYFPESRRMEPRVCFKKRRKSEILSPALVAPGTDAFVTNRGEELSPAVLEIHSKKIQNRRSVSSPVIIIQNHEEFVTDRKAVDTEDLNDKNIFETIPLGDKSQEHQNSLEAFQFNMKFDPRQPQKQSISEKSPLARYQQKRGSSNVTPSKIPMKESYILKSPSISKNSNYLEKEDSTSKFPRPSSGNKILPPRSKCSKIVNHPPGASEPNIVQEHLVDSLKVRPKFTQNSYQSFKM